MKYLYMAALEFLSSRPAKNMQNDANGRRPAKSCIPKPHLPTLLYGHGSTLVKRRTRKDQLIELHFKISLFPSETQHKPYILHIQQE